MIIGMGNVTVGRTRMVGMMIVRVRIAGIGIGEGEDKIPKGSASVGIFANLPAVERNLRKGRSSLRIVSGIDLMGIRYGIWGGNVWGRRTGIV